jgi:DNA-binding NarL/FixJ family response regulator
MPIRVAIVEDDPGVRAGLVSIVRRAARLQLAGSYDCAEAALKGIPEDLPDVLLADINLPGRSGIELVAELKGRFPRLLIMMITVYEDGDQIFASLQAGASGYLLKRSTPAEIVQATEQLHAGGSPMSPEIARKVVSFFHRSSTQPAELKQLTARELEILTELSQGYLYKEIADRLKIGLETVRTHVHHIYEKLHVQSRTEAVVKFLQQDGRGGPGKPAA